MVKNSLAMLARVMQQAVPSWVREHPERRVLFPNDHLQRMRRYRDDGPTYPVHVVAEFADITFVGSCGTDDDTVIDRPPHQLPAGRRAGGWAAAAGEVPPVARRLSIML
ncbi:hypothetical protein TPA0907_31250 [Micromonospora humidisoli]|uniref:phenolic acid decarboxylase n=1 Tax=Micromonospora sp. AKA109 TaxID=2733865 RepID=UPI0022C34B70|nr:phenolic acid decarboxylase [Micromonospora sp. AKA109]GHJ08758.1 hypothetical protein TPA0907_31250 [Micromonospora sp. AKA109]